VSLRAALRHVAVDHYIDVALTALWGCCCGQRCETVAVDGDRILSLRIAILVSCDGVERLSLWTGPGALIRFPNLLT
jgi:hypothetical protein